MHGTISPQGPDWRRLPDRSGGHAREEVAGTAAQLMADVGLPP